jgi:putative acetyltransferase
LWEKFAPRQSCVIDSFRLNESIRSISEHLTETDRPDLPQKSMNGESCSLGSEISIRQATNDDCDRVIHLVRAILAEFGLPFDLNWKDADLIDIETAYIRAGGMFEVVEDKRGRLLGTCGLFPLDNSTCELRKMYFLPEIRGLGLGREVLLRAVDHAQRLGFKSIVLETISVLERAIHLYTRFGFVPTTMDHPNARVDQRYILKL